jgi:p-aminobenzoyl-glutamate transporter AbgT
VSRLRVALVLLGDALLCVAIVLIVQIDKLINVTLYSYGLVFSDSWAQPYWLMLRVCLVLMVAAIILISVVELPYPAFEEKADKAEKKDPELVACKPEETEGLTVQEVDDPLVQKQPRRNED